jgi:hypothetical protein
VPELDGWLFDGVRTSARPWPEALGSVSMYSLAPELPLGITGWVDAKALAGKTRSVRLTKSRTFMYISTQGAGES